MNTIMKIHSFEYMTNYTTSLYISTPQKLPCCQSFCYNFIIVIISQ